VILLCGIPTESPLALVAQELAALGHPFAVFHQRRWAEYGLEGAVRDGSVTGRLRLGPLKVALEEVRGVYTRLMDDRRLPGVEGRPADDPWSARCRALHAALAGWTEVMPGRVVNRAAPQGSNASKPYQAQLIARHGLAVPQTLVTNDPEAVLDFRQRHGRVMFKSISGVRSIVRELHDDDLRRLERIRWCPVQFQERVEGFDVRVHCVGGEVHACAVASDAVDYRYAVHQVGTPAVLKPYALDGDLATRCRALTDALGLELSGIDLRLDGDGRAWCFEVNPSPAFSYYEHHTGLPIARAIARHLAAA
jgi:hypothetical protein